MNNFPVFNKKIAEALILRGFNLVDVVPNKRFKYLDVFYFEKTKEFELAFLEEQIKVKHNKVDK